MHDCQQVMVNKQLKLSVSNKKQCIPCTKQTYNFNGQNNTKDTENKTYRLNSMQRQLLCVGIIHKYIPLLIQQ